MSLWWSMCSTKPPEKIRTAKRRCRKSSAIALGIRMKKNTPLICTTESFLRASMCLRDFLLFLASSCGYESATRSISYILSLFSYQLKRTHDLFIWFTRSLPTSLMMDSTTDTASLTFQSQTKTKMNRPQLFQTRTVMGPPEEPLSALRINLTRGHPWVPRADEIPQGPNIFTNQ